MIKNNKMTKTSKQTKRKILPKDSQIIARSFLERYNNNLMGRVISGGVAISGLIGILAGPAKKALSALAETEPTSWYEVAVISGIGAAVNLIGCAGYGYFGKKRDQIYDELREEMEAKKDFK